MSLAACSGKTSYTSWTEADRAARGLRRKVSAHCQGYRCPACSQWHIGNSTGPGNIGRHERRRRMGKIIEREMREALSW